VEPAELIDFMDFATLTNLTELAKLTDKRPNAQKRIELLKKRFLPCWQTPIHKLSTMSVV